MILDLAAVAADDVSADQEADIPVFRVSGPRPSLALSPAAGGDLLLSPGSYIFAFEACVASGKLGQPTLVCRTASESLLRFPLTLDSPFRWSATFEVGRPVTAMSLEFGPGACAFLPTRMRIDDRQGERPYPTLSGAAFTAVRAVFRMSPHWLRSAILNRRIVMEKVRPLLVKSTPAEDGGRLVVRDNRPAAAVTGIDALSLDFEERAAVARNVRDEAFVERGGEFEGAAPVKLVAYYLPQFHPIPENDAWWGKGFTEWTNVTKAIPQFAGHYQPRLPGELGFYDLRTPGVMAAQAELARAYGVSAFCFHYYWFAGKRLLETPVEAFLKDRSIDIGFTLCWANENWARTWDGAPERVLMQQQHSREDHSAVFDDLARQLEDPRALNVSGKPVLLVYRPAIIPDVSDMLEIWRERAHARGWPGLYLIAANTFYYKDWARDGFDGMCEFPPHSTVTPRLERKLEWLNKSHSGAVFDYSALARNEARRFDQTRLGQGEVLFPGVMPAWDNEARRPGAGSIYHGSTPNSYADWLAAAVRFALRELPDDRRMVFVNAWNEWAEGAHLEPDRRYGRAYLAATAEALRIGAAAASIRA